MVLERVELLIPLLLLSVEPSLEPAQALRTKPEYTQSSIFGASLVGDHPGMEEHAKVSAHGGWGEACRIGQLACAHRSMDEKLDHLTTRGVRKRAQDAADIYRH
jgi:predicted transglutaminase-like cysteine proteinase